MFFFLFFLQARKWHDGSVAYGKQWQEGDMIGCLLDMQDKTISFSLNGELMMDAMGQEIAFKDIDVKTGQEKIKHTFK